MVGVIVTGEDFSIRLGVQNLPQLAPIFVAIVLLNLAIVVQM